MDELATKVPSVVTSSPEDPSGVNGKRMLLSMVLSFVHLLPNVFNAKFDYLSPLVYFFILFFVLFVLLPFISYSISSGCLVIIERVYLL